MNVIVQWATILSLHNMEGEAIKQKIKVIDK